MKKIFFVITTIIFILTLSFGFVSVVYTEESDGESAEVEPRAFDVQSKAFRDSTYQAESPKDPRVVVSLSISYFLSILGTLLLAYLVYGGFLVMTSGGEEDKVTKGKKTIGTATLGIVVILGAYGLTRLIFDVALGGEDAVTGDTSEVPVEGTVGDETTHSADDSCTWIFCKD